MASSSKKKTTMAKLNRESRLRERRVDKQAKKDARKQASARQASDPTATITANDHDSGSPTLQQTARDAASHAV